MTMPTFITQITISHFLVLAAVLFAIGVAGVLFRRNAIIVMMAIELMLNAANMTIIAFARHWGEATVSKGDPTSIGMSGQALAFIVIAVAAAEAAVGLAIVVAVFRNRRTAHIDELTALKH
jgi:NADH-quinone oxidoreductase subunit K